MKESLKFLITGQPRSGKTTLVSQISNKFKEMDKKVLGFITTEVRSGQSRIGFKALDLNSNNECWLARKTNKRTKFMVGYYNVFITEFESFLTKTFEAAAFYASIDLIVIDEIGKMELFSKKFESLISEIFNSNIPILATIGQRLKHPFKNILLQMSDVKLYELKRKKFDIIKSNLVKLLSI